MNNEDRLRLLAPIASTDCFADPNSVPSRLRHAMAPGRVIQGGGPGVSGRPHRSRQRGLTHLVFATGGGKTFTV